MGGGADSILYTLVGWVLLWPHFTDGETEARGCEGLLCVRQPPTAGARSVWPRGAAPQGGL